MARVFAFFHSCADTARSTDRNGGFYRLWCHLRRLVKGHSNSPVLNALHKCTPWQNEDFSPFLVVSRYVVVFVAAYLQEAKVSL